jgi:hypothetical protein
VEQSLINESVAAEILDLSVQTLRNWRHRNQGPAYRKLGGRAVRYSIEDLQDFMDLKKITPEVTT